MNNQIEITESAAQHIKNLIGGSNYFRIKVSGGGCAGFQYNFEFTNNKEKDDNIFTKNNVKVIVDETSLSLINGSKIDYVNELIGSSFKIENPKAISSCGCGTSFSL